MAKSAATVPRSVYPQPDTHAARILDYIKQNEGTTKNAIIEALGLNPSVVRDVMRTMVQRNLVTDKPDSEGRHHFTAKVVL
jgi:DNA-binding IclR family transcriptional regulator